MRVAIVGANLLGCASAFYVRKALRANQQDAEPKTQPPEHQPDHTSTDEKQANQVSSDEIVIFEQLPRAGGHKFVSLSVAGQSTPAGTAATFDVLSSPPLTALLADAAIPIPNTHPFPSWAVLDWRADEYRISRNRHRLFLALANSNIVCILLHLLALFSTISFFFRINAYGLDAFITGSTAYDRHMDYPRIMSFFATLWIGAGIIPPRYMLRFHAWLHFVAMVRIISIISYGSPSLSILAQLAANLRADLQTIVTHDSVSSAITLGHLLSVCGMAKHAKVSASEFFGRHGITPRLLTDALGPALSAASGDTRVQPDISANALAAQFALSSYSHLPASLGSTPTRFDAEQTTLLCPALAKAADARLQLETYVSSVMRASEKGKYVLSSTDGMTLGTFDAVLLAAVVDPTKFETDSCDEDLRTVLVLPQGEPDLNRQQTNAAAATSLVMGRLRAGFFRAGSAAGVADETAVVGSGHVSAVARVGNGDEMWRVSGDVGVQNGSNVGKAVFEEIQKVQSIVRPTRPYELVPLREVNGRMAPTLILGTRFLNLAAVDRIANDVSLDVLAARNAGSFFRNGVVSWKE